MDFYKMNRQWTEFLDEAKIEEQDENEQVIFEVSQQNYQTTMDWMTDKGPEDLAFPHIFGNKMRILEFLQAPAEGTIGEIIKFFNRSGWDVDFHSGLVTKEVPHERAPSGFKTLKRTIGKALQGLINQKNKWEKLEVAGLEGDMESFKASNELRSRMEFSFPAIRDYHLVGKQDYEGKRTTPLLDDWMDFWNKKSQFYREHPDDAFSARYPVIISRHPVDVMRMADWEQVASCHSPPESEFRQYEGTEFACAMKEAQGLGLVVYTLDASQANEFFDDEVTQEKLDRYDNEEIFSDDYRDVDGLDPINRGRIRKFVYESGEGPKLLGVPETRIYGKRIPGFYEVMKRWAMTVQKEEIKDLQSVGGLEPGDMGQYSGSKWVRLGGSYKDTDSDHLFNRFFDSEEWDGNAAHKPTGAREDSLVDTTHSRHQEYEQAVEELEHEAQMEFEHCTFNAEVDGDFEETYIHFSGGMIVSFGANERAATEDGLVSLPQRSFERDSDWMTMMRALDDALEDLGLYTEDVDMHDSGDVLSIDIAIVDQDGHYGPDPDGAYEFLQWVKEFENKYDEVRAAFQDVLLDHDLLKAAPADVLRSDDLEFEHFEVEFEHDEDGGMYEVTSISAPIGTGLNPPNILAGAVDGKPSRGTWRVLSDYAAYGAKISWKSFANKLFKLLDTDIRRAAARYVQQELPLNESKEELTNSAVEAYRAIYDGFNVTMAARPHAQYDAYNNRIPRGELDPFEPEQMPLAMSMRFQIPRTLDDTAIKFAMEMINHIDENFDDVLENADAVLQQYNVGYKKYLVQRVNDDELARDEVKMEIEQLDSIFRRYKGYFNNEWWHRTTSPLAGYKILNDQWKEGRPMPNLMKVRREETIQPLIQNFEKAEPLLEKLMKLHDFWAERLKTAPGGNREIIDDLNRWINKIQMGMQIAVGYGIGEFGGLPPNPAEWIQNAMINQTSDEYLAWWKNSDNLQEGRKRGIRLKIRKARA